MADLHDIDRVLLPGVVLVCILAVAYSGLFGFLWDGCTPGRKFVGIRLVDKTGLPPRPARAMIRAILAWFSFVFFFAGFWLALFDRRGQALHDKLTSTFVVRPS